MNIARRQPTKGELDSDKEAWLQEQVVPAAQALKAAPGRGLSADQTRKLLSEKRQRCT